ncbi:trace amine-associated receptor 13c-like [Brachionichthys hirsutus]|uniref:trace amine-associated receptor 13c-like n=1 Tax=Brachionichthys hirsutus TaxID=412623 RepID=UPI0036044C24
MMETLEEGQLCFPELVNTSCTKPQRTHAEALLIYILLSFISVVTMTLNLLVIISISHFRQLHTPTNLLLLSLAVSDFFVGILMSFQILITNDCWFLGDLMCVSFYVLLFISTSASVGTIVLISVDRYVAICYPLHYSTKITVTRVTICISFCWICSILYVVLLMVDNLRQPNRYTLCSGDCVIVINYVAGIADIITTFFAPVTIIIFLYMRVFVVAVSQARAMRSHITSITLSGTVSAKKSELKAARTLGVVIVVFLTCLCPYFISSLLGENSLFSLTSVPLESWLFNFNSCLNPVIYAFCYSWYRKTIKLIVTLKVLEPDSCEISVL